MSDIGGGGGVVSERFYSKDHGYFIDGDRNTSLINFTFKFFLLTIVHLYLSLETKSERMALYLVLLKKTSVYKHIKIVFR